MADLFTLGIELNTRMVRQGTRDMDRLSSSVGAAAAGIVSLVAATAGLTASAKTIANFEDAMLGLQATIGGTADQMAMLEGQARKLGATSVYSAEQAAQAQRFLAQAGFSVNEVMQSTAATMQLATAGQLSLAEAADIASNVLGGMRLEVDQLNRVNDVMAKTASSSNTDIRQLGEALSYAAPLAATAGVSIEEASAAIGRLGDAGLQGSRAGTGLIGFIRQLSNLTPTATDALSNYGLTAADVNIESRGLLNVMDSLGRANINTADSFAVFGSEAAPAAGILAASARSTRELTGELQDAEGAAQDMADIIGSGLNAAFAGFNSQVQESILQLGDSGLAEALRNVTESATGVLAVYNGLLPEFVEANGLTEEQSKQLQLNAGYIEAWAGAIGGATAGLVAYRGAAMAAAAATRGLTAAVAANPIGLLAVALGTAAGLMYTLGENTEHTADETLRLAQNAERLTEAQRGSLLIDLQRRAIELQDEYNEALKEQQRLEAKSSSSMSGGGLLGGVGTSAELLPAQTETNRLKAQLDDVNQAIKNVRNEVGSTVIEINSGLNESFKNTGEEVDEIAKKTTSMIDDDTFFAYSEYQDAMIDGLDSVQSKTQSVAEGFDYMAQSIMSAMEAFSDLADNGDENAQRMASSIDALNYVLAGTAALNAMANASNVYEALAAGAAMAAAVAGLGYSIGNITGGFESGAERRQEQQGAGTVLGDLSAKSESLVNAMESADDALSQLVGINSDGFEALKTVLSSITGASNLIARDVRFDELNQLAAVDGFLEQFDPLSNILLNFANSLGGVGDVITTALNDLLGGKSRISDEGLIFASGTISDVLNEGFVQAFAEVGEKKNIFDDWDYSTRTGSVSDQLSNQVALVFQSMADSVEAAAEVLGIDATDAIQSYVFDSITVSLKDLDPGEQMSALESVFSAAFDNFAGAIIPAAYRFQNAGEGIGETVSRLATNMTVTDEAVSQLGLNDLTGTSDEIITISTAFAELAGGASDLAGQLNDFVSTFASDERQLEILTGGLARALGEQDIAILNSRDGVYDYIASLERLDGDNVDRIGNILSLTDSIDEYFDLLEAVNESAAVYTDLQIRLAEAQDNDALATRLYREREYADAIDDTARNYLTAIYAAEDYADSISVVSRIMNERLSNAVSETDSIFRSLSNAINLSKQELADRYESERGMIQKSMTEISESVSDLESVADSLKNAIDSTVDMSYSAARAQLLSARNQIAALAESGIVPEKETLDRLLKTVTGDNAQYYATAADYYREQGRTANDISDLSELAEDQLTEAERTVRAQEGALEALKNQYDLSVSALDDQLSYWSDQLDISRGTFDAVMLVEEAIKALEININQEQQAQSDVDKIDAIMDNQSGGGATAGVSNQEIRDYIGYALSQNTFDGVTDYDAAERLIGLKAIEYGVTSERLASIMGISKADVLAAAERHGLPAFANGGTFSQGGLALVGERGPEIVNMPAGTHVSTAQQTGSLMDNSQLVGLVQELIDKTIVQNGYAKKSYDILNQVSTGGKSFNTDSVIVKTL